MGSNTTDGPDYSRLGELHFSKLAIACYQSLCEDGAASATQLADRLNKPRTGLYRQLRQLERKGFVVALKTEAEPTYFYRVTVEEALDRLMDYQLQILKPLIKAQSDQINRQRALRTQQIGLEN